MTFAAMWGEGRDLDAVQMVVRGAVVFFVTLALVRISGRRSFARPGRAATTGMLQAAAALQPN